MDVNNLITSVQAFFIEQYKGVEHSDSFLSFEPLGSMIDPEDFMDESGMISEIKATEQVSILGDRLPEIADIFLTGTTSLSSVYEVLIESAVFSGSKITAEDKTAYISKFGQVKSDSLQQFEYGKKASITTPEGSYLPVHAYPKKWYDPDGAFWVAKVFSTKEAAPNPPSNAGTGKAIPMVWRTRVLANPEIVKIAEEQPQRRKLTNLSAALRRNGGSQLNLERTIAPKLKSTLIKPLQFTRLNSTAFDLKKVALPADAEQKVEMKDMQVLKHFNFADRIKLTNHFLTNNPAPEVPVHADEFSMEFEYCIVYLDRPWFNTGLFHYANMWYCLMMKEKYFSSGEKDESNDGLLKCIPTAMILIKDLKIKASWTDSDKQQAQDSIGLGIFNLSGSTFSNNELATPGMQIIGWMCEVLPKLPAMDDPNVNFLT
ncbi:hypothetical protein [Pedobacter sp. BMA]|uniref:hypothetical protein n=1 Tax=Pedobacter sp. BMA TaxID=1663685 RepID=UPI00064AB4D4|nr:hypothetical protein [Pedobacter sp. BMA]KLT63750.1 hypothetical protein AB669_20080 [Pedobacter sp. BMA]